MGSAELSMNCGIPTESAARRPLASRIEPLRSLDWLRMGVVAVRLTYVATSQHTVSIAPRMTSAVTGSTAVPSASFPRCPASSTRSTSSGCRLPDVRVTFDSRLPCMSDPREFRDIRAGAAGQAEDAPALPVEEFMAGLEALQTEVATAKNVVW